MSSGRKFSHLWPMELQGLYQRDENIHQQLQPMSLWLWSHHVSHHSHLIWAQVPQQSSLRLSLSFILRSCDSRNLNLSPFCNTSATSLVMWQTNVEETYGKATASYVSGISGPMRLKYPRATAEKELIHSLTKVLICLEHTNTGNSFFSLIDIMVKLLW